MDDGVRTQVVQFLQAFKKAAVSRPGIQYWSRPERIATLRELEYTRADCDDIILSLSVDNYSSGPEPDRNGPGEVWIFGVRIEREIYIKLGLDPGSRTPVVLSFHWAVHPLQYPFREGDDRQSG